MSTNLTRHWTLGVKLVLVGTPFLLMVLISTVATLWVSWQLDGGAAAVNEAGRMRMQSYRMSLSVASGQTGELPAQAAEFDQSLKLLKSGDPERPLFVPWDETVAARFTLVESDWLNYRAQWISNKPTNLDALRTDPAARRLFARRGGVTEEELARQLAGLELPRLFSQPARFGPGGTVRLATEGAIRALRDYGALTRDIPAAELLEPAVLREALNPR